MPKPLTERQVWLAMAKLWKTKARRHKHGHGVLSDKDVDGDRELYYGLCRTLGGLCMKHEVGPYVENTIRVILKHAVATAQPNYWPYAWPNNKEGVAQRVKFCRDQARLCK